MSWTPNYGVEPHAFAQVLDGPVPFTPNEANRGEPNVGPGASGGSTLVFEPALESLPSGEDCYLESLHTVWLWGRRLASGDVVFPAGWSVTLLEPIPGWPGTVVEAVAPSAFEGLSVEVAVGVPVLRVVALTVWRGAPGAPVFLIGEGGGPVN